MNHISSAGFTFGSDHGRAFANAPQSLAEVSCAADERHFESVLVHVMGLVGMPRRYAQFTEYEFLKSLHPLVVFVSVAAIITAITQLLFYFNLVWINLMWGMVNLLPIWPLDGGQAAQVVLTMFDRRQGTRRGHIVSLLTAGVLAVLAASQGSDFFLTIFFGMFAFINFQVLQSLHQAQSSGVYHDDDWWKR